LVSFSYYCANHHFAVAKERPACPSPGPANLAAQQEYAVITIGCVAAAIHRRNARFLWLTT
jgi:hypothetical protein